MDKNAMFEKWKYIAVKLTKDLNSNIKEDVRQDIYLSIWQALDRIDESKNVVSYLFTVANGTLKKSLKKYKSYYLDIPNKNIEEFDNIIDCEFDEDVESNIYIRDLIEKNAKGWSERQINILIDYFVNLMSYSDISAKYRISKQYVSKLIGRFKDSANEEIYNFLFCWKIF